MTAELEWLKDEQAARCAYGTREGDGRTCDCKYGAPTFGVRGEMTGCPELRSAIWTLTGEARITQGEQPPRGRRTLQEIIDTQDELADHFERMQPRDDA